MTTEAVIAIASAAIGGLIGVIIAQLRIAGSLKETNDMNRNIDTNTKRVAKSIDLQTSELRELKEMQHDMITSLKDMLRDPNQMKG